MPPKKQNKNNAGGGTNTNKKDGAFHGGFGLGGWGAPVPEKQEVKDEVVETEIDQSSKSPKVEDMSKVIDKDKEVGRESELVIDNSLLKETTTTPVPNSASIPPPTNPVDTKLQDPKNKEANPAPPESKPKPPRVFTPIPINTSDPTILLTPNGHTSVSAHRGLLTHSSSYFRAYFAPYSPHRTATSINFAAPACTFSLPPTLAVLKTYTHWLYTGSIALTTDKFHTLAQLYIFGTNIAHREFCNAVMDEFVALHVRTQAVGLDHVVGLVYAHTGPGSPLRRLLAECYAWNLEAEVGLGEALGELPKEFLVDVLVGVGRVRERRGEEWWGYVQGVGWDVEGGE